MSTEIFVADLSELPEGEAREFEVEGIGIVMCNDGGEIYALESMCTHQDLPLDGAEVEEGVITCEWHGATFDVRTGAARSLPATRPLRAFETQVRDGRVHVVPQASRPIGRRPGSGHTCSAEDGAHV